MKNYKLIISLVLVFGLITFQSNAKEFTKEIKKEFNINSDATLKVNNIYGMTKCQNWDKNKISIEVVITLNSSSNQKAEKMFDNININITGSRNLVKAITDYKGGSMFDNADIQINYFIFLPKSINVDIYQKYGTLFIEEIDGLAKLGIKYGTLQAENLNHKNEIYSAYSTITINEFNSGIFEILYSELSLDVCKEIGITSKYSTLSIDKAEKIKINSAYDNISIDKISSITNVSKFSNFSIDKISTSLNFELKYGKLDVDNISPDFSMIKIDNHYANADLGISSEASYKLDAEVKYGGITYPKANSNVKTNNISNTLKSFRGTIGRKNNPKSTVLIRSKNCTTNLYK